MAVRRVPARWAADEAYRNSGVFRARLRQLRLAMSWVAQTGLKGRNGLRGCERQKGHGSHSERIRHGGTQIKAVVYEGLRTTVGPRSCCTPAVDASRWLVLDLRTPEVPPGGLLHALLTRWPGYLAYVTSYLYVAVNWLNHKSTFHRIRCTDCALHWANLGVLFSVALLPFATAVVSQAVKAGDRFDEGVAVALYGLVGVVLSAAWLWLYHYLSPHGKQLQRHVTPVLRRRAAPGAARDHGLRRGRRGRLAGQRAGGAGRPAPAFLLRPVQHGFYDLRRRLRHR